MAHSTDNYRSGGVIMEIALWDGTSPPIVGDLVDVGNLTSLTEEPTITKKKHNSHRSARETVDKKITAKEECALKWSMDELSLANLALFFQGVIDGSTIKPMEADEQEYLIRVTDYLQAGTAMVDEWSRVSISAAGALEKITHGDGDEDWTTMEMEGEVLYNETPISFDGRTHGHFGLQYVAPTT